MRNIILKYVLKNALNFQGKANPQAVLGMVLKENPNLKTKVPKVMQEIGAVIKEVNSLPIKEIEKKLKNIAPELLTQTQKPAIQGPLKPLPNAKPGKVVVRIAPSPSGPLHIGHAYGVSLNYEYAKMYNGQFILRIEDTNAENIYEPAYKLIEEDVQWLTENKVAKVVIQSSRLGNYYDYAEQLVKMGKAYVCTCDADSWREMKNEGKPCPCRNIKVKEQQIRFAKMFNEYAEGEAVLRLKTDITDKNPAMRDFAIMRIVEHVHPKTKKEQRVWPLMVFSVAVDDHELGITHVLNGKDQADNAKKEQIIMEYLGWKLPGYQHWGMINFIGMPLSTSGTRKAIEQKEYSSWDDIRLPFLRALRKRGYQPEAFRKFAVEIGLSLNDKTVPTDEFWKMVNAFNKEIIEPKANRYFFVDEPVKIEIKNAPEKTVEINLHPNYPDRGKRLFKTSPEFYISLHDFKRLGEGYVHRLMDCHNLEVKGKMFQFVPGNYEEYKNSMHRGQIIHWLPATETVDVEVLMENNELVKGKGELGMMKLNEGDIVQLERRYFARLEKKTKNKLTYWYLHK